MTAMNQNVLIENKLNTIWGHNIVNKRNDNHELNRSVIHNGLNTNEPSTSSIFKWNECLQYTL